MAELSVEPAFAKFPILPAEIRYMIWEAAIPGPRIVTIRQKALDRTLGAWFEKWHLDEKGFLEMFSADVLGITSNCKPPQILFVCKESYRVASKFYHLAFGTEGSFGKTYFDFQRDVLYLRYDTLRFISPYSMESSDDSRSFNDLPSELSVITNLEKVTNLAILIDPGATESGLNDFYDTTTNLTHWVAQILTYFGAVSKLILVVQHYKFEDHDDQSTLLLMDPIDLDEGFQQFSLYTGNHGGYYGCGPDISDLYYTGVDEKLLQSHLTHLTRNSKRPQSAPAIDYHICVTEEAKEVYENEKRDCELYCEERYDDEVSTFLCYLYEEEEEKGEAREARDADKHAAFIANKQRATGKNLQPVLQKKLLASKYQAQESNVAVHFTEEDFSDDDHVQAAIELNDADFSDDDDILAAISAP